MTQRTCESSANIPPNAESNGGLGDDPYAAPESGVNGGPYAEPNAGSEPGAHSREPGANPPNANPIECLRTRLEEGELWPTALLEAIAIWTAPEETFGNARLAYLIGGEAFDWLTLANRLTFETRDLIPTDELEALLFTGRFPSYFEEADFRRILGVDKYSAYLNYFYGVEVELALQYVVEEEIEKRFYASGRQYATDHTDQAFQRIYRSPYASLLASFRDDQGSLHRPVTTLTEMKEFTYWLFKRRVRVSDKAKLASDTRRGISALDAVATIPEEIEAFA